MKRLLFVCVLIFLVYFAGYIFVRQTHSEIWKNDGKNYVIFPENKFLYYLYRPLSVLDEKVTGIQTHIGQHQ